MSVFPENRFHPMTWVIGEPEIGSGTWIGPFCLIDGSGGLTIGEGCDISAGTHIYTHSSALRCVSGREYPVVDRAPVTIGRHVFIGANSVINKGVTIGDEAIVGSGCVITKDVPPRTVWGGVPGRQIGVVDLSDPAHPRVEGVPAS